ncbi:class F sortase [Trebonia kvetii]|uniref:class F sortase n=1 Tax=Trebonia kvetii TaxID=2480626 RepID=UPI001652B25F|nr:class F sortase [Trebonia kvetii]
MTRRLLAVLALTIGLIAASAAGAGFVLNRQPVAVRWAAAGSLPVPIGPIAALPQSRNGDNVPRPVTLIIPSIGVQTKLTDLGVTASGALQVPPSTTVAGWYARGPRPGAIGSAVIAGHIDSRTGPGVFFFLSRLHPGDRIYVRRADKTLALFRVTAVRSYAKQHFPTLAVYGPVPDAELRLITCGGTFDPATRSYLSNVVVYAVQTAGTTG